MTIRTGIFVSVIALPLLLAGCSTRVPPEISQKLNETPTVQQVRSDPDAFQSQTLRWGGTILQTENRPDSSRVLVVAFPLSDSGRPQSDNISSGRFIAVVDAFLEPLVYSRDRKITVVGKLVGTEVLKIGEFDYTYPIVQVEHYYLWPVRKTATAKSYDPYWYDPYYPWHFPHHY